VENARAISVYDFAHENVEDTLAQKSFFNYQWMVPMQIRSFPTSLKKQKKRILRKIW